LRQSGLAIQLQLCGNVLRDGRSVRERADDGDAGVACTEHGSSRRRAGRETFPERTGDSVARGLSADLARLRRPKVRRVRRRQFRGCTAPGSSRGGRDILHAIPAVRRFAGLSYGRPMPDETTVLNFLELTGRRGLGEAIFEAVRKGSVCRGDDPRRGASVRRARRRTTSARGIPGCVQPPRGQWHFGMKARIGADEGTGLTQGVGITPASNSRAIAFEGPQ